MILVTGGAGFIGSNFVHRWLQKLGEPLLVLDALTYAGLISNLEPLDPRCTLLEVNLLNSDAVGRHIEQTAPRAIVHFAAETHVDRAISEPELFVQSNINGTFSLLNCALQYWRALARPQATRFRFINVSTDEVYGSLASGAPAFNEESPFRPNNPYAATKASADHLVRAFHKTYGLPTITTNCSNNYGPRQLPEKLIPLMISRAGRGAVMPLYGDGRHRRDWLFVDDHCDALMRVLEAGEPGQTYNIGGSCELENQEVVRRLCTVLDELRPHFSPHDRLIQFVPDRPGHDRRYAIDSSKIRRELGWLPANDFVNGLKATVRWYLDRDLGQDPTGDAGRVPPP